MKSGGRLAGLTCAFALFVFALLSWRSFEHECATMDEPLHAVGAYLHVFDRDYRINPEDPPLWNYWMMLPHARGELHHYTPPQRYRAAADDVLQDLPIVTQILYRTAGNDAVDFINTSRGMMLIVGVVVGLVLSIWAYRLAGAGAAVAACVLFCFDPNFIAHAPLLKNDVFLTVDLLAVAWSVCALGRRVTIWSLAVSLLLIGVAPLLKFSGVLVVGIAVTLMGIRALRPSAWPAFGFDLHTRARRVIAALTIITALTAGCVIAIWATYGFRFDPTPEAGLLLNSQRPLDELRQNTFFSRHGRNPQSAAEWQAMPLPLAGQLEQFAEHHRLLPQAWLFGLLYTYQSTLVRPSFLFDHVYDTGHWYYFPCAMVIKTPIATLLIIGLANASLFIRRFRYHLDQSQRWSMICIVVPLAIYSASALATHLNLGVRHVLPIYPLIYLLTAWQIGRLSSAAPRATYPMVAALLIGLIAETTAAYPRYISFFNLATRSHRLDLLGDSNLDWGQDLPWLHVWQSQHATEKLYLAYWASADPAASGIVCTDVPCVDLDEIGAAWPKPDERCVLAVSATLLQGLYSEPSLRSFYTGLRRHVPREIVGDTIYLYDWPLK